VRVKDDREPTVSHSITSSAAVALSDKAETRPTFRGYTHEKQYRFTTCYKSYFVKTETTFYFMHTPQKTLRPFLHSLEMIWRKYPPSTVTKLKVSGKVGVDIK